MRALWFTVHTAQSDWIPVLTRSGFDFHHAKSGSVSMLKWLPESETCQVSEQDRALTKTF